MDGSATALRLGERRASGVVCVAPVSDDAMSIWPARNARGAGERGPPVCRSRAGRPGLRRGSGARPRPCRRGRRSRLRSTSWDFGVSTRIRALAAPTAVCGGERLNGDSEMRWAPSSAIATTNGAPSNAMTRCRHRMRRSRRAPCATESARAAVARRRPRRRSWVGSSAAGSAAVGGQPPALADARHEEQRGRGRGEDQEEREQRAARCSRPLLITLPGLPPSCSSLTWSDAPICCSAATVDR